MKLFAQELSSCIDCGNLEFRPYAVLKSGEISPENCQVEISETKRGKRGHIQLSYANGLQEDLFIEFNNEHIICTRRTSNSSDKVIELAETGLELKGVDFGGNSDKDYFYHVENPRIYSKSAIPVDMKRSEDMVEDSGFDSLAGNRWADPGVVSERIGASPYQPFPAVLLSNFDSKTGLVHGTLSQKVFYHNYLTGHRDSKLCLDVLGSFKALGWLEMAPGKIIEDVWYLGRTDEAHDIQKIFDKYAKVLREYLPPMWGATDINRNSIVWGSWNDGIFRDIDQERLLKTADFLADNFPTVEWMQIDDGYAKHSDEIKAAHGLGMPYEGAEGIAKYKFPEGFKGFTDKVKQKGLLPAVWIGGHIPNTAKLPQEKPDWGVDYSYRIPERMVLDVSKPEVREYMKKALDFFFLEGGFVGMKHDFWSYAFEDSHDLLANKDHSGYEWRDWWLKEIRKRIPDSAYLQTGCDIVMGNPFLGQYFTNYRYGIDIGGGNWDFVKTNFLWGMACFALHIGDLFVPNSDSVGVFPGLTDAEALLCINYCLITRSMVELAGWLYDEKDNPRFKWLKKTICCPNNGQDVFFADYDYRNNDSAPEIWYLKTPHFTLTEDNYHMPLRTVALFNLEEEEREFSVSFASLGLDGKEYLITDVWTEQTKASDCLKVTLQPHESVLFAVSLPTSMQILDSDLKIDEVQEEQGKLIIDFAFEGEFTLILSTKPKGIEGVEDAKVETGNGNFKLLGKTGASKRITIEM